MRKFTQVTALIVLLLFAGCLGFVEPDTETSRVVDVVDGDTVDVRVDGETETIRLVGVDTPETSGAVSPSEFGFEDTPSVRACLRSEAIEATQYVEQRVEGQQVTLTADPNTDNRGSFGRLLRYVSVSNQSTVNQELVEQGYARVYTASDFSNKGAYLAAEQEAREAGRNVWSCGGTAGASFIGVINADATGDDRENLNGEYVVIQNPTNETVNLSGWTVSDEASHTFEFQERTLRPDGSVTLRTGTGSPNATVTYWNASSPIWNNGGDTVTVRNKTGGVVAERAY